MANAHTCKTLGSLIITETGLKNRSYCSNVKDSALRSPINIVDSMTYQRQPISRFSEKVSTNLSYDNVHSQVSTLEFYENISRNRIQRVRVRQCTSEF